MCGINGIAYWKSGSDMHSVLGKMNDAIAHRGPDAEGVFVEGNIGLGHRRLSIIDTSAAGNQPFYSSDKNIVVVFNGEIYNYIELKEELQSDYHFLTSTDTEVIIAAYLKWGEKCVERFIGMFGLALLDKRSNTLFIYRDRLGVKPIYFAQNSGGIIFSSEIRAIIRSGLITAKIDGNSLIEYLKFQSVQAPKTILQGVEMLMPGCFLRVTEKAIETIQYWSLSDSKYDLKNATRNEVKLEVRRLLEDSVALRMRADVPFGAFLSGGIDSSIVVGLMSKFATKPVNTFSITFHETEYNEEEYSSLIADLYKTDHHNIKLSANDFLKLVPEALNAMDHPSGDGPNTYVVSKVTREAGVKMAMSGLGGDEVFAGYDVFKRVYALQQKKWIAATPRALRALAASALNTVKPSIASQKIGELLKSESIDVASTYALTRQLWMDKSIAKLCPNTSIGKSQVYQIASSFEASPSKILSYVSKCEMKTYMLNVLLRDADQMSMASALEIRVPFLDHRLVDYVLAVTDDIKFPHSPKQLLVESCADVIPDSIVNRPKMGFTFPWAHWMKNELKPFCEEGLESLKRIESLDHMEVMAQWNQFLSGSKLVSWSRMWPLVVLGHWVNKNQIEQ
jgi:asparagine synthase (glutamine-hydrolysing)